MNNENLPQESNILQLIMDAIDWSYARVIDNDFIGLNGAETLADDYKKSSANTEDAINSLINWQVLNAGTAGFVAGLGGFITLPVAIPANLASVIYLQIRMIAAIAHLRGYDIRSDRVKSLVIACLVGSTVGDFLKGFGVNLSAKIAYQAIKNLPRSILISIHKAVGFRIFTKFGAKGLVNMADMVPFIGGVVSGAFDATTTNAIGTAAKEIFKPIENDKEEKKSNTVTVTP